MPAQPDSLALLAAARDAFCEILLPRLPEAAYPEAGRIAQALDIVLRELTTAANRQSAGLSEPAAKSSRRLATDIRAGRYDEPGPDRDDLHNKLRRATAAKLAIDNPEYK